MAAAPTGWSRPGFGHTAHACAAVDGDGMRGIGQKRNLGNDRQAGRGIDVISAVLYDGALRAGCRAAAELGCNLDYDALGRTQADAFWRVAGQQQPRRPRRPQRRTGAGGVAAAQQSLPAADVVLKLGLRLCAAFR